MGAFSMPELALSMGDFSMGGSSAKDSSVRGLSEPMRSWFLQNLGPAKSLSMGVSSMGVCRRRIFVERRFSGEEFDLSLNDPLIML